MALTALHKVAWHARGAAARLGWMGWGGVALLLFAAVFRLSAVSAVNTRLAEAKSEAQTLYGRYQLAMKQPQREQAGIAPELETFYEFFPAVGTLPQWLSRLYAAAGKRGLPLDLGEYRLVHESGKRLARYQMTLPIKGSYEQIRGFVSEVLDEIPAAALDDVVLRRESIGSKHLEARIRLTLFLRVGNQ